MPPTMIVFIIVNITISTIVIALFSQSFSSSGQILIQVPTYRMAFWQQSMEIVAKVFPSNLIFCADSAASLSIKVLMHARLTEYLDAC